MEPEGSADDDSHPESGASPPPPNWGIVFDLGLRLGISVGVGLGVGLLLDNWLGTRPIFTLIGMVVGISAAMYTIWDVARDAMRK
jgi:ATP synthase protein I